MHQRSRPPQQQRQQQQQQQQQQRLEARPANAISKGAAAAAATAETQTKVTCDRLELLSSRWEYKSLLIATVLVVALNAGGKATAAAAAAAGAAATTAVQTPRMLCQRPSTGNALVHTKECSYQSLWRPGISRLIPQETTSALQWHRSQSVHEHGDGLPRSLP